MDQSGFAVASVRYMRETREKEAQNMAKLTVAGLPWLAMAMMLPIRAITRVDHSHCYYYL